MKKKHVPQNTKYIYIYPFLCQAKISHVKSADISAFGTKRDIYKKH